MNTKTIHFDTRFLDLQIQEEKHLYAKAHPSNWQVPYIDTSVVFLSGLEHIQEIFTAQVAERKPTEGFIEINACQNQSWLEEDILAEKEEYQPLFDYLRDREHIHGVLNEMKRAYPALFRRFVSVCLGFGGIGMPNPGCFYPITGAERVYVALEKHFDRKVKKIDESLLIETIMKLMQKSVNAVRFRKDFSVLEKIPISHQHYFDDPLVADAPYNELNNGAELLDAYCAELTAYDYLLHNRVLRERHHTRITKRVQEVQSLINGFDRLMIYHPEIERTMIAKRIRFLIERIQHKWRSNYAGWLQFIASAGSKDSI